MFKYLIHIVFSFLLLFATTGLAMSKHFCGEYLISTSLFAEADSCCDTEGCCRNETDLYQVNEYFSTPDPHQLPDLMRLDLLLSVVNRYVAPFTKEISNSFFSGKRPPPPYKIQKLLSKIQSYLL